MKDMARRIRLAVRDKRQSDSAWTGVDLGEDRLDAYLATTAREFGPLIETIRAEHGVPTEALRPVLRADANSEFDPDTVRLYLSDELNVWHDGTTIEDDFFMVTREPWSRMGAVVVYELTG